MHLWSESTVNYILETNYELQSILKRKEKNHAKAEARIKDADKFLEQFSPEGLFEKGRELNISSIGER